jgi:hypothetical protein
MQTRKKLKPELVNYYLMMMMMMMMIIILITPRCRVLPEKLTGP